MRTEKVRLIFIIRAYVTSLIIVLIRVVNSTPRVQSVCGNTWVGGFNYLGSIPISMEPSLFY